MPVTVSHALSATTPNDPGYEINVSRWNETHAVTLDLAASEVVKVITAPGGSISSGTLQFSNSNGVSFGMNAGTLTASHNGLTSQSNQAFSAAGGSSAFQTIVFANSNGVSFSNSNGSLVGSVATNYAASDHSHGNPTLALTNLSGTTASNSAGFTLSLSAAAGGGGADGGVGVSAGANSVSAGTVVFSNSNGVSFGLNGSTVTASHNGLTTAALSNHSHAFSAAGGSSAFQTLSFANSNGLTFSNSNGSVVASYTVPTVTQYISATNTTFNGTNVSGSITHNTNGLRVDLSVAAPGGAASETVYALGNTTVNSSGTFPLSAISMRGYGVLSLGTSNGSLLLSTPDAVDFTQLSVGNSNLGNTAGDTGVYTGRVVFVGSNNITLSGSSNGGSATLSIIGAAGGAGGVALSAGANSVSNGTVVFSNSNGVSFGLNGSTVTASHNALTSQSNQAFSAAGGSSAFQTLSFSNANGATFTNTNGQVGLSYTVPSVTEYFSRTNTTFNGANISGSITNNTNGLQLSLSVAAPGAAAEQNAFNLLGANTAGNTTATGSTIGLSGVNLTLSGANNSQIVVSAPAVSSLSATGGLSMSTNGSTISIGFAPGTATMWQPFNEGANVMGQHGQATMHIVPLPTPVPAALGQLQVDRLCLPMYWSNASNSTGSATISAWFGLYTRNDSTLSLAHSTSYSTAFTFNGTNEASQLHGIRLHTVPWTTTIGDGRYYVGVASRTTTGGANGSASWALVSQMNSNFSGVFGAASNRSNQWPMGYGVRSASTAGIPSSIPFSHIDGTASLAARPPSWFMISGTA